jgi:hypothetical protein
MPTPKIECIANLYAEAIEAAGGEKYREATAAVAGFSAAVRPDSRSSARHNAELRTREAAALRAWAYANECMFDNTDFDRRWKEQGEMGGSENDIIYDERTGRVWKRNRLDVFCLSWRQFFDRIFLHNYLFPEAALRFEGFLELGNELYGFISQPDIVASSGALRKDCESMMRTRGFRRRSNDDYESALLKVEDLHSGNVLVDVSGNLLVIDPAIFPKQ